MRRGRTKIKLSCESKMPKVLSGWNRFMVVFALLAAVFVGVNQKINEPVFAEQLGVNVNVTNFELRNNDGATVSHRAGGDASQNPEDYAVKLKHNSPTEVKLVMDVDLAHGKAIAAGDTISIPIVSHLTSGVMDLQLTPSGDVVLYDQDGMSLGTFAVRNDDRIEFTFNERAAGVTSLKGLTLNLGRSARASGIGYDRVGKVTIGGNDFYFGIEKRELGLFFGSADNFGASNNMIVWGYWSPGHCIHDDWGKGGDDITCSRFTIDQFFPGATGVENIKIMNPYYVPLRVEGDLFLSDTPAIAPIDYIDGFVEVTPVEGEKYEDFYSRVNSADTALQYGYYIDDTGVRIVVNYGKIGVDTPFANANDWAELAASGAIGLGYYSESDRQELVNYYLEVFGDSGETNQLPAVFLAADVYYPTVLNDTIETQTINVVADPDFGTSLATVDATLTGMSGFVATLSNEVVPPEVGDETGQAQDDVDGGVIAVPDTGSGNKEAGGEIDVIGLGIGGIAFAIMAMIYAKKTGKRKMEY